MIENRGFAERTAEKLCVPSTRYDLEDVNARDFADTVVEPLRRIDKERRYAAYLESRINDARKHRAIQGVLKLSPVAKRRRAIKARVTRKKNAKKRKRSKK